MTKVHVQLKYSVVHHSQLELPAGKEWRDVQKFLVVWNTAYVTFEDGSTMEHELDEPEETHEDYKHPKTVCVFESNEDGTWGDFDKELKIPGEGK